MKSILADLDFYKLTTGQFIYERLRDVEVVLRLHNRSFEPLIDYLLVSKLNEKFEEIRKQGFTTGDIAILSQFKAEDGNNRFTPEYLNYLSKVVLPPVEVTVQNGDIAVSTRGPWAAATMWETVIMSEINEQYYKNRTKPVEIILQEGNPRLQEKLAALSLIPGIRIADFGTRRRHSYAWHELAIRELIKSPNFLSTSNPFLAYSYGVHPIGTYPHEPVMVYGALWDALGRNPLDGQAYFLNAWYDRYGQDLSVALTDTFTSDHFLNRHGDQILDWKGVRQDSGNPIEFGEKVIDWYKSAGVDPTTKTIVFSDGLDLGAIINIYGHFQSRVKMIFGWGTNLTNDMGLKPNNFVVKVVEANGMPTVKLSDDPGKQTGPQDKVSQYQALL